MAGYGKFKPISKSELNSRNKYIKLSQQDKNEIANLIDFKKRYNSAISWQLSTERLNSQPISLT